MSIGEVFKFLILRTIGNFLVLFAVFGVFATFGPAVYYETQFRIANARGVQFSVLDPHPQDKVVPNPEVVPKTRETKVQPGFRDILTGSREQILIPKDTEFSILIPKIGASAKVYPNVDSSSSKEFLPILENGVAHAQGTVFPGMQGNIYLFAHSADNFWNVGRYNAVFYLIKDLDPGDEIVVFFQNRRYNYIVSGKQIADAKDVEYLTKSQEGPETLVLQTCWPPGTTWKRLFVLAKPK